MAERSGVRSGRRSASRSSRSRPGVSERRRSQERRSTRSRSTDPERRMTQRERDRLRRETQRRQEQRKRQLQAKRKQQELRRRQEERARRKEALTHIVVRDADYYDYNLLAIVILLTCFGLVMLYSTSAYVASLGEAGNDMRYFGRQAAISAGCLALVLIGSQFDYHFLARFSGYLYFISVALLIATKAIGRNVNGATRWIYIGPISFQPAELAKLSIILFLPWMITKIRMKGLKAPIIVFIFGLVASLCTYKFTDNLSSAVIILGISAILVFIAHPKTVPFLIIAGGGAVTVAVGVMYLISTVSRSNSFRINRILVWLDPESHSTLGGYQVMQGLYAIGSGGFLGKGLGNSAQKLGAVPEAQNDMIFSIICEELGIFGAALLMLMFVFMLYRLVFIAQNAPDLLGSLISVGVFCHIAIQVILNIAVVINLIPTTGITLPFVSYGGTSIVFLMAEMAIALSVSKQIRFKE